MNIVIATPLGRGGKGGIDRIMDEVREALAIAAPGGSPDRYRFLVTRGQRGAAFSAVQLPLAIFRLGWLRVCGQADLVHINLSSHGSTQRKMVLAAACRRMGIPYILHLHGSRMRQYWLGSSNRTQARIELMFSRAEKIIVLGQVWRAFVTEHVSDVSDRIIILPNATRSLNMPHVPDPTQVRILFLGRIGERKGVPQLIDALAQLPDGNRWHATIAGDGDIEGARERIAAADLGARVDLPGWVGPAEVERALANADVLVLPSFDENLPMSVIEGMAAGLAVVATPVGATEEIVHDGETGLLVQPGDVNSLAAALNRLVSDADLRMRLGRAARAFHGKHLEIAPYTARLVAIWREAARNTAH